MSNEKNKTCETIDEKLQQSRHVEGCDGESRMTQEDLDSFLEGTDITHMNDCECGEDCGCKEDKDNECSCGNDCECESKDADGIKELSPEDKSLYEAAEALFFAYDKLKDLNSMMALSLIHTAEVILQHTSVKINELDDHLRNASGLTQDRQIHISESVKKEIDDLVNDFDDNLLD